MLVRAQTAGLVSYRAVNPRDFTSDPHRTVDGPVFGGGPGMLLMPGPVGAAIESLPLQAGAEVVFLDPAGDLFTQKIAKELSQKPQVVFLCGHYEGIDERVAIRYQARRLSLGDFVLTGGEFAALVMADSITRLIPGVLGDPESLDHDSHSDGMLSAPQFTRPQIWEGLEVPEVLLSGNHGVIEDWRRRQAIRATRTRRPDLFLRAGLEKEDLKRL